MVRASLGVRVKGQRRTGNTKARWRSDAFERKLIT
jgi:hypothetical protein